jgi:trans-aconitate methyltransferase
MKNILKIYEDAFRKYGDSQQAVLWPKGRQEVRFHALTRHIGEDQSFSLLDYGCGLAHLKPFLDQRYRNVDYSGADAVNSFIETCRLKYSKDQFFHVESPIDIKGEFDYIVSSGAFNMLYSSDSKLHRKIVFEIIEQLFHKTKVYLSVNMMTDVVDFKQQDAYHQNVVEIYSFVSEKLSRRLMLDHSYMPYEFTLTVWKDQYVQRPENLYAIR